MVGQAATKSTKVSNGLPGKAKGSQGAKGEATSTTQASDSPATAAA